MSQEKEEFSAQGVVEREYEEGVSPIIVTHSFLIDVDVTRMSTMDLDHSSTVETV